MIKTKFNTPGAHLECNDLTPNQKMLLWDVMKAEGASQGFAYDRFFKEGFREWELIGVDAIKAAFIEEHQRELWTEPEEDGTVGYAAILANYGDTLEREGGFYDTIGRVTGLKKAFTEQMNRMGMGTNQVLQRFTTDNWKPWQRRGIRAIIDDFERRVKEENVA